MIPADLPLSLPVWLAASSPIVLLLILLVWRRWSTAAAGPVALAAAVLVAVTLFATPAETLAVAVGKGIWDALFIIYVIWPSLILYNVANEAGAFDAIQKGVRALMPDRLLLVLAFGWVLSSFIQSIAGFGTPLAVTTPLLLGIGVRPVQAVVIPLIGATWGNVFGSLGVPWVAMLSVVDLDDPAAAVLRASTFLWIANLTAGLAIAWMYGRGWALRRAAPAILTISLLHGGLQMALVPRLPSLGNFIATSVALGAIFLLARIGPYRQLDRDEPDLIFAEEARTTTQLLDAQKRASDRAALALRHGRVGQGVLQEVIGQPAMSLAVAFAPYVILGGLAIITLMVTPLRDWLGTVRTGFPFPETTTGYLIERGAQARYAAFAPLTHPGTLLLISAVAGYAIFRIRGLYPEHVGPGTILGRAAGSALPATSALVALLLISKVMDHSGEMTILALGLSEVAPGPVFVAASNLIGITGTLVTSSSTASNLLFGPLQTTTAAAEQVSTALVAGAQAAGSAVGGAIAPGDILLGATVAGVPDRLGAILARGLPWVLVTGALVSATTLVFFWTG